MIGGAEIRELSSRLSMIESIAIIPVVKSTNAVARRVVDECIDNEIPIPSAVIVAGKQLAGKGRGSHSWHSPAGSGIYLTVLHSRPQERASLLPLEIATVLSRFLSDVFGIDARIKWPNDIMVHGRKIGGVLIEARISEGETLAAIGVGINVHPIGDPVIAATSIEECGGDRLVDIDTITIGLIEALDDALAHPRSPEEIVEQWRKLSAWTEGDRIATTVGERRLEGSWAGIDHFGRALLKIGDQTVPIAAGELVEVRE